jgi:DNA-binding transcriptional ArsR family regulator
MELPDDPFRAIADPTRRAILSALRAQPLAVHEIAGRFDVSRPAISKHLRVLTDAGLVAARRAGKENLYELRAEAFAPVAEWVGRFWGGKLATLKALAERRT